MPASFSGLTGADKVLASAVQSALASLGLPTKTYVSPWKNVVSADGGSLLHLLGAVPDQVILELLVITATNGLPVGKIIPISLTYDGNLRPSGFWYDATSIDYKLCPDTSVFSWINAATGGTAPIPNANIQWRVRAWA